MKLTGSDRTASTVPSNLPDGTVDAASPAGPLSDGAEANPFRYRVLLAITAAVALLVAGLIVLAVSRSGDDGPGSVPATTSVPTIATSQQETVSETTTQTTPTTMPPTSVEPGAAALDEVAAARADFAVFIAGLSGDQIKPNDANKVIADVDEALALVADGKVDEAQRLLDKSFELVDKIKSDDPKENATLLLERLANAIGLESE